jgi:hypothetical protein
VDGRLGAGRDRLARHDAAGPRGRGDGERDAHDERRPDRRRIRDVIAVLDGWLEDLDRRDGPDVDAIDGRLRAARDRLEGEAR